MNNKERLQRIVDLYDGIENFLDKIPDQIPTAIKNRIKKAILEDKELKDLINDIKNQRPPRLQLIGNTGHGKSSLINALLGYYNAHVSDIQVGTKGNNEKYNIFDENGETIYTIFDSRGINESTKDGNNEAEETLLKDISEFTPDAIIYVHKASERAGMDQEIKFLKNVAEKYFQRNGQELPLVFVLTKCDELAPSSKKTPNEYNEKKLNNIHEAEDFFTSIIKDNGLNPNSVIVTSALMEYEQSYDELEGMPIVQRKEIRPETDGRYHIDELQQLLFDTIKDTKAIMGAAAVFRSNKILKSIANRFTHIFASIGGIVAAEPIPIADIFILCSLEALLVMLVALLAGRELSYTAAGEFVVGLGGVAGIGFAFRAIAQQAAKLANLFPGAGTLISAAIATAGIESVGNAAIKYYFND